MIEKRRYERVQFFCEAAVTVLPDGAPVPARSLDISLGGVAVVTRAAFEPGQIVAISFFLKDASQKEVRERVVGRVVNLRADVDANRVGVEFAEPLHKSKNPELLSKLLKI